jgi:hypothetical protein
MIFLGNPGLAIFPLVFVFMCGRLSSSRPAVIRPVPPVSEFIKLKMRVFFEIHAAH